MVNTRKTLEKHKADSKKTDDMAGSGDQTVASIKPDLQEIKESPQNSKSVWSRIHGDKYC